MRNPLASIRACAELTLTDDLEGARESARDIIGEADRLDPWARGLLPFSASQSEKSERVRINALLREVLEAHRVALERASIVLNLQLTVGCSLLSLRHKKSVADRHARSYCMNIIVIIT
jgi:signal transduction histidine kinase